MTHTPPDDTLIVYLKEPSDWQIVKKYGIYRIRHYIKHPPTILANGAVKYIAFYLPSKFGKKKYSIRHYAAVRKVSVAPRYQCVPDETRNAKSQQKYYKIDVEEPQELKEPIFHFRAARKKLSRREMILFPTLKEKLETAQEFNFLFRGSYLEERMWKLLIKNNILPEREWPVKIDKNHYYLDFAIFCKDGYFSIEVDGQQHLEKQHVIADVQRMNNTNTHKWKTYRFYKKDLEGQAISRTLDAIRAEIKNMNGLDSEGGLLPTMPLGAQNTAQLSMFSAQHLDFLALRGRVKEKFENNL